MSKHKTCLLVVVVLLCQSVTSSAADTDGPFRWKFKKGQTFAYQIQQKIELELTVGATTTKTTVEPTIDLLWTVGDVNPDTGDAEMTHKITRIAIKLDSPVTGKIELDSDTKAGTEGAAKFVAPVLATLAGSEVKLRMSPRGDINNVRVPTDVLGAFKAVRGAALFGEMFSQEGFRKLIKQASMVLPDKAVEKGTKHVQPHVITNKLLGKMNADTTYTYQGLETVGGSSLAKFAATSKIVFDPETKGFATVLVKDQKTSGALYFDPAKGRLDHSTITQQLHLDISFAGQKFEQQISSDTKLTLKDNE